MIVADIVNPIGNLARDCRQIPTQPVQVRRRYRVKHPNHSFNDVVDIGEIATMISKIKYVDRFPSQDLLRKSEQRHIRTAPRAIASEKPKTCGRHLVEMAITMCHQLVGLFGCCVKRHWVIHIIFSGKG